MWIKDIKGRPGILRELEETLQDSVDRLSGIQDLRTEELTSGAVPDLRESCIAKVYKELFLRQLICRICKELRKINLMCGHFSKEEIHYLKMSIFAISQGRTGAAMLCVQTDALATEKCLGVVTGKVLL